MKIYENQALNVILTDIDGDDISLLNLRVDYWSPSNVFSTPTGSILDGNISKSIEGDTTKVSFIFDTNILNEASRGVSWKFQLVDDDTNVPWSTKEFIVLPLG